MHHKILQLISLNEQDFANARQWFRETPPEVKEHIWHCIQNLGEPEDNEDDPVLAIISRFAQLGMALVAEQEYRKIE